MRAERPRGPRPGLRRGAEEEAEALPRQVVCWPSRRRPSRGGGRGRSLRSRRNALQTAHTASPVFRPAPTPANYKFKLRFAAMAIPSIISSSTISKSMIRKPDRAVHNVMEVPLHTFIRMCIYIYTFIYTYTCMHTFIVVDVLFV